MRIPIVERVLDDIAHKHLDACWWIRVPLEVVRGNARICHMRWMRCLIEGYLGNVVETIFRAFPSSGRERAEVKGRVSLWSVGVGKWEGKQRHRIGKLLRRRATPDGADGLLLQGDESR